MNKIHLRDVISLRANNNLYLKHGWVGNGESNILLYISDKKENRFTKSAVIESLLNSDLVKPFEILLNSDNSKLACFYLERLKNTKGITEVDIELDKITELSESQKELMRKFMSVFHSSYSEDICRYILINSNKNKITESFKQKLSWCAGWILLSYINYLHILGLGFYGNYAFKRKFEGYPKAVELDTNSNRVRRSSALLKAQEKYTNDSKFTELLNAIVNGDVESVRKLVSKEIWEDIVNIPLYDGNTEIVKELFENGLPEIVKERNLNTLLISGVCLGNYDLAKYMLEKGADSNYKQGSYSVLNFAVSTGREDLVRLLFEYKADPNVTGVDNTNELMTTISLGHIHLLEVLLDNGIYIDAQNSIGLTALMRAIVENNTEAAELLIARGANLELADNFNNTALMLAAGEGNSKAIKLLINKGVNIDAKNSLQYTALITAAGNGYIEVVEILLRNGAKVDIQNSEGSTALFLACLNGHHRIVKLLLEHNANPNHQTMNKFFALIAATMNMHAGIVETLLEYGANPNLQDSEGNTALICAAAAGYTEIVKILIRYNTDLDIQNFDGRTALFAAIYSGEEEITKILVKNGANIMVRSKEGLSPLLLARNTNLKIMQILLGKEKPNLYVVR